MTILRVLSISAFSIALSSCASVPRDCESTPEYVTEETFKNQEQRLFCAYQENSQSELTAFLDAWAKDSREITPEEFNALAEPVQHAYAIFEDFYRPKQLDRIGDSERGADLFSHVQYFLVQSTISVAVQKQLPNSTDEDFDEEELHRWEIDDFRPRESSDTPHCIVDDRYAKLLDRFLGSEELPAGHSGLMSTSTAQGESFDREDFINQKIQIYHGHWGGWNLVTDPNISTIVFDEKLETALVYFSLVYEGGEALYQRDGDEWSLVRSELTWIT